VASIETSVASLRAAGGPEPLIVADGFAGAPPMGLVRTFRAALERLVREQRDATHLLILEDDTTWPAGGWDQALDALQVLDTVDAGYGYASLNTRPRIAGALEAAAGWGPTGQRLPPAATVGNWYRTDTLREHLYKHQWAGAQAWVLTMASGTALLQEPEFARFCARADRSVDHHATEALIRLGLQTYTLWPSLVSHALGEGNRAPRQRPPR
jgi:hypothetical protein